MNGELEIRGTMEDVWEYLRELAWKYPGWTVDQYIGLKRLERIESKQFEQIFDSLQRGE